MSNLHELYMTRCLQLAQLGQGHTHPNPMVGSVVLDRHGVVVGEGFHVRYGEPHAEVNALNQAGDKAQGGTLYVNLEPCSHTGKTPPCANRVIASGVKTVVVGMTDPNPKVSGEGIGRLQAAGITVITGVLEAQSRRLNEAFCHFVQTRRPYVVLKLGMTLDGRIATRNGKSRWITSPLARRWVHQLRSQCDGILTTAKTILQDDSQLTLRKAPVLGKPPVRLILDRQLRLDPDRFRVFRPDEAGGPVWVFTGKGNLKKPEAARFEQAGVRLFEVGQSGQGLHLGDVFEIVGQEKLTQLLVEAGGRLAGTLLQQQLANKLWLLYGSKILADSAAKPGFTGAPQFSLADAPAVTVVSQFNLENTLVVEAYPIPQNQ